MQTAPVVTYQQPYVGPVVAPIRTVSVKATRGLGITQIIFGALCLGIGIAESVEIKYHWASRYGYGLWGGAWIIIGGIFGVCSAARPSSSALNGLNMLFAIVSSLIAFGNVAVYSFAVYFFAINDIFEENSKFFKIAVGVTCSLLLLMLAEFGISIAAAVVCCKHGCGCCHHHEPMPQTQVLQSYRMAGAAPPTGTQQYEQPGIQPQTQVLQSYRMAGAAPPTGTQQYEQPGIQMQQQLREKQQIDIP